jgi:hypothetical protein
LTGRAGRPIIRISHLERAAGRSDHRAFDAVLKLAHIARPRVVSQRCDEGVRDVVNDLALTLGEAADEMRDEKWNDFRAFS